MLSPQEFEERSALVGVVKNDAKSYSNANGFIAVSSIVVRRGPPQEIHLATKLLPEIGEGVHCAINSGIRYFVDSAKND
jgi:hypothetical protein